MPSIAASPQKISMTSQRVPPIAFMRPISLPLSSTVVLMVPATLLPAETSTTAVTISISSFTLASSPSEVRAVWRTSLTLAEGSSR